MAAPRLTPATFSGSYSAADVTFLLKPIDMPPIDVEEKEQLIQSGARHYSEMISPEFPPSDEYLELFERALQRHRGQLARDILCLASALAAQHARPWPLVIASLARAGTPIGVLLHRSLQALGVPSVHYSISIIRDRGIDTNALDYIVCRHDPRSVVFLDGWTGKGAIAAELLQSIRSYNRQRAVRLDPRLCVVADLAGVAGLAGSSADYLIPCSILNATVSGLVSRTILHRDYVAEHDFHACIYYDQLHDTDRSRWFIDSMMREITHQLPELSRRESEDWSRDRRRRLRAVSRQFVGEAMRRFAVTDRNRLKPGIGETTRALLRRIPDRLLVKDPEHGDVAHLLWLASRRGVAVEQAAWMPYQAAAIIRSLGNES